MSELTAPYRLEMLGINKSFPGVQALSNVSLQVYPGEIHALVGENGAGKSTLMKILSGAYPRDTGKIFLDGGEVEIHCSADALRLGIVMIYQESSLSKELSVAENIFCGRLPRKGPFVNWKELFEKTHEVLFRLNTNINPHTLVKDLSPAQCQMVEIAKALSKKASLLFLDEPTAALPEADTNRLLDLLRDLARQGVSCIYISHRLEEVFRVADRVTVLRDGRSISTRPTGEADMTRVISDMVGREVKDLYHRPPRREGRVLLKVEDWRVEDPLGSGRPVVKDVSFEVRAGEVLGVAGLMGAGRTALLASLFGAGRGPVTGRLSVDGTARAPFASPAEAIAAGVALVSEDRKRYGLVLESSVGENLVLSSLRRFAHNGFLDHGEAGREAGDQVRNLRIKTPGLPTPVGQLSGGNQQKVVVGKWLITAPKVLLLDEPTRGIDVGAKSEMYDLIGSLAGRGLAVVLVSSDLPEVLGISHRVLVMNQGRATGPLDAGEATPEKVLAAATLS